MSARPAHVVVVGRDAALWLSAAALRHALGPTGLRVTAVELPSALGAAALHVSLPPLEALHARLGIDEGELLRLTGGSFTLGVNLSAGPRAPAFLAHGAYGVPIAGTDFFAQWLRARASGLSAAFEDFCPTAVAARQGRVLVPDAKTEVFGRTDYAYHLPARAYAGFLKALAARLGVEIVQAHRVAVARRDDGIESVRPDGGAAIAGDLFVDATGNEALLIGDTLGVPVESWRDLFPGRRRLTGRAPRQAATPVYTEVRRTGADWLTLAGTPAATWVTHVTADDARDPAAALAQAAPGLRIDDARLDGLDPGRRVQAWAGNCVAIGEAACRFDPLFDPTLHAIHQGIVHLLSLFPATGDARAERTAYNRATAAVFDRVRDVQAAAAGTAHGPRADSLSAMLDGFRARGLVAPFEGETFSADLWRALLLALGVTPETWPPEAERIPAETVKAEMRRILGFVRETVLAQPTHDAYLATLTGAPAR